MDPNMVKISPPATYRKGSSTFLQAAIRLLAMLVLMGCLLLWIMIPTNTYQKDWLPNIRKKFTSTYFGIQGPVLLLYSLPILLVALLGCVYLHLIGKGSNENRLQNNNGKTNDLLATWKKPMLVKGPLGIIRGIELAFLIMFITLLIWSLAIYLHNGFATIKRQSAAEDGENAWKAELGSTAWRLGLVGNICLSFLFFPVARGSSVLPLLGLTSEASIKYHVWLGHLVMAFFTTHGLAYIIYWSVTNQISEAVKWDATGISNLAGELSLLAGLAMWSTTFPRIRRKMFELFFYTHYLYILFMVFFIFHVGIAYACIMLPGFYLFLVDRYLRFLQSRQHVRLISARVLPCQTLELNFSKSPGLSYNPTSILFMNIPSISKLQWHPFTITSSSNLEPEKLSVVIKGEGSWSKKLYQTLSSPSPIDCLDVSVEGPYGLASTHILRHDTLVTVSGGSGITPFISLIRELIFLSTTYKCRTPEVVLISAFKYSSELTMLDLLLPIYGTPSLFSHLQLRTEAYVTREKEPSTGNSKLIGTIWFKSQPTDAPISAILGPNGWLWLGAIISSSFLIFLIIIGLITRYYIYPIEMNTNQNFSSSLRAFFNMAIICASIAMMASVAFLWNKKKNAHDEKQFQNPEGSTPAASPGSGFCITDELESLPHQSIVQATNVHYGKRPDLKSLLLDCKGSSVGVLVCGPNKMGREVAAICSSGLADNLQFESINFSW